MLQFGLAPSEFDVALRILQGVDHPNDIAVMFQHFLPMLAVVCDIVPDPGFSERLGAPKPASIEDSDLQMNVRQICFRHLSRESEAIREGK